MPGHVPRHQALAEALLDDIGRGRYAVGERLPTETELAETHRMARGTVRQALARLEDLGLIERRPSAGTIVIAAQPAAGYQPVAQSIDDIRELAATTRLVKPDIGEVALDAATAKRLGLRRGSRWFRIAGVRVRRDRADKPLCWSEHYQRAEIPRDGMIKGDPPGEELGRYRIEQTISATVLTAAVAKALDAEPGSAGLVITRRLSDPDKHSPDGLINLGVHIHPADRFQLTSLVTPGNLTPDRAPVLRD